MVPLVELDVTVLIELVDPVIADAVDVPREVAAENVDAGPAELEVAPVPAEIALIALDLDAVLLAGPVVPVELAAPVEVAARALLEAEGVVEAPEVAAVVAAVELVTAVEALWVPVRFDELAVGWVPPDDVEEPLPEEQERDDWAVDRLDDLKVDPLAELVEPRDDEWLEPDRPAVLVTTEVEVDADDEEEASEEVDVLEDAALAFEEPDEPLVPELRRPELAVPELAVPELAVPELAVPELPLAVAALEPCPRVEVAEVDRPDGEPDSVHTPDRHR